MKRYILSLAVLICTLVFQSCSIDNPAGNDSSCLYARYFDIIRSESPDSSAAVVVISPYGKMRDTLIVEKPLDNIICMSSSQVAGLAEIGADDMISAVSGLRYITNQTLHERKVPDIGYEVSLDYEKILSIKPDVILAYTVSGSEPPYLSRLRDLGIRVLILHDHLERNHSKHSFTQTAVTVHFAANRLHGIVQVHSPEVFESYNFIKMIEYLGKSKLS